MKKLTLLFAFITAFGLSAVQAQSCQKAASTCCKSKAAASAAQAEKAMPAEANTDAVAAVLASLDADIERKECGTSGKVSYMRKETDAKTGQVVLTAVEYDAATGRFVNLSPSAAKACCKNAGPDCCAKAGEAGAVKTSGTDSGCHPGTKKTKAAQAEAEGRPANVRLVKSDRGS